VTDLRASPGFARLVRRVHDVKSLDALIQLRPLDLACLARRVETMPANEPLHVKYKAHSSSDKDLGNYI
jgi:hypothetical protein